MHYRTIEGLDFAIHSPSCYELMSIRNDVGSKDRVFVEFDGGVWNIAYHAADGHVVSRAFAGRDYAIRMIADRAPRVAG
jgi:hypothetical protein